MSNRTLRKIGFWVASAMVVGSIVGVAIFFTFPTLNKFSIHKFEKRSVYE